MDAAAWMPTDGLALAGLCVFVAGVSWLARRETAPNGNRRGIQQANAWITFGGDVTQTQSADQASDDDEEEEVAS